MRAAARAVVGSAAAVAAGKAVKARSAAERALGGGGVGALELSAAAVMEGPIARIGINLCERKGATRYFCEATCGASARGNLLKIFALK